MGKVLALDYGTKRTGVAVTDNLKIIASGLATVPTKELNKFLTDYLGNESVETIVIGIAIRKSGEPSQVEKSIVPLINFLKKRFPALNIEREDEGNTSQMALETMIAGGVKKQKRSDKSLIDKVSATIILQRYLERIA